MVTTFGYMNYLDKKKQINSKFVKKQTTVLSWSMCYYFFEEKKIFYPQFFFYFSNFILLTFRFLFSFLNPQLIIF